jgi:lipoprotein-anchoring transpeptidase ErfK/SrfK
MQRRGLVALVMSVIAVAPAFAGPLTFSADADSARVRTAAAQPAGLGGGFIEFLFGGGGARPAMRAPAPPGADPYAASYGSLPYARSGPAYDADPVRPSMDPRYERQVVDYAGRERPGTVIIDTRERFLYLIQGEGTALRYGIGVGRPGFTWSGVKTVSMKREWPDWIPPDEMLRRRPDLPRHMAGGPDNPLGARALYLGSSLYRIHGSNEPWTIGTAVSSGCIRMRNEDVIDLYDRVRIGTRVLVI